MENDNVMIIKIVYRFRVLFLSFPFIMIQINALIH
nr:MAG TPA: hypothetical protein [Caudoviricetes sp.]